MDLRYLDCATTLDHCHPRVGHQPQPSAHLVCVAHMHIQLQAMVSAGAADRAAFVSQEINARQLGVKISSGVQMSACAAVSGVRQAREYSRASPAQSITLYHGARRAMVSDAGRMSCLQLCKSWNVLATCTMPSVRRRGAGT